MLFTSGLGVRATQQIPDFCEPETISETVAVLLQPLETRLNVAPGYKLHTAAFSSYLARMQQSLDKQCSDLLG